jgi:uncharacterized glyoxalase superfamily protein PhnB
VSATHKPQDYNSVSPYLMVAGADATIDFLKRVFSAVDLRVIPDVGGGFMRAGVRVDDSVVVLADAAAPDRTAGRGRGHG